MENLPPFYVGQNVVVIQDVSNNIKTYLKEGSTVKVIGLRFCCQWLVDVGLKEAGIIICTDCKQKFQTQILWCTASLFAPIEQGEYKNVTKELAVLPQDEVPDVKKIKELVN